MLHYHYHPNLSCLVGIIDVVDRGCSASTSGFDNLGAICSEVEVAWRVNTRVGFVTRNYVVVSVTWSCTMQDREDLLTKRAAEEDMVEEQCEQSRIYVVTIVAIAEVINECLLMLAFTLNPFFRVRVMPL
jgi:hypothetical protein